MVTLGTPVSGYGQESHNRAARQRIPNRVYNDDKGREHVQARPLPHPRPPPMCRFGQEAAGFLLWSWHCLYRCTVCLAVLSGAASGCSCGCWECFKTRPEGSVIACFSAASSASFQDSPIKPVRLFWIFSRALGFPIKPLRLFWMFSRALKISIDRQMSRHWSLWCMLARSREVHLREKRSPHLVDQKMSGESCAGAGAVHCAGPKRQGARER